MVNVVVDINMKIASHVISMDEIDSCRMNTKVHCRKGL